ncbi:MAG: glycosyltransferase [Bacteroidota bacterium]|nr:glycosyltransferase [Bacteroidota bacterium]
MSAKKVLFLSPYPFGKAASQRLKFEQYFNYFEANGFQPETSSFIDEKFWNVIYKKGFLFQKIFGTIRGYIRRFFDLFRLHKYDIVYIHLWATPLGPPFFEWLIRKLSKKIVYDIDDMIYKSQDSAINNLIFMLKGKDKPVALMRYADHVITCTPDLNEFAKQYCEHCTDISSTLDTERLLPVNNYTNDKTVVIGWTGTHSTVPYLYLLTNVLQQLSKERKFILRVIGNFKFQMEGVDHEYMDWNAAQEAEQLQGIDIGLYPLPIDSWVMGKSGLKALTYMTFGLPVVATNVGAAINRIITDNENGFLVKTDEEWIDKLKYLIDNPQERKRLGTNARQTVVTKFSIEANKPVYLGILKSLT